MSNRTKNTRASDVWQQLTYGAAIVARMYPNYALFCELAGGGDAKAFNNILNLVWEFCTGQNQRIDFEKQLDKLELITPDPEHYDVYGVWPALDAAVALASLLGACERWDEGEIVTLQQLSRSTIDGYLDAIGEVSTDQNHPLLDAEEDFQHSLQVLFEQREGDGRAALVAEVRRFVSGLEVSNIGLEIT